MKKTILGCILSGIFGLCFANQGYIIYNFNAGDSQICITYDGGVTWQSAGTADLYTNALVHFDANADAVAVGAISDCQYNGTSWIDHKDDQNITYWTGSDTSEHSFGPHNGSAYIFWQGAVNSHGLTSGLGNILFSNQVPPYNWFYQGGV